MSKEFLVLRRETLVDIADAIRLKTGNDDSIAIDDLDEAVENIQPTGTLVVTENGEYDVSNYAKVIINIGGMPWFTIRYSGDKTDVIATYEIEDSVTWSSFKTNNNVEEIGSMYVTLAGGYTFNGNAVTYNGVPIRDEEGNNVKYYGSIINPYTTYYVPYEDSGYTATFQATSMYDDYGYYSVDNGNTWQKVTFGKVGLSTVKQVKLKIVAHEYAMPCGWTMNGSGILDGSSANKEVISDTITLTEDTTFEYTCYD